LSSVRPLERTANSTWLAGYSHTTRSACTAAISLYSGASPAGVDIELDRSGSLQTIAGSISFSAADRAIVNGSVLARGSGSEISLHAANKLTIGGRLEADRDIRLTAGTTLAVGEVSIVTESTSSMKSLGGGGAINVIGLNAVSIDSRIGPGSASLNRVRIESTAGTLSVEGASGWIETDGDIQLVGQDVELAGVIRNLAVASERYAVDVQAHDTANVTANIDAVGSVRIQSNHGVSLSNGNVSVSGVGHTILVQTGGSIAVGAVAFDASGKPLQHGELISAPQEVRLVASGSAIVSAGAQIMTSGAGSLIRVDGTNVDLAGSLRAGAMLGQSQQVQWVGGSADVQISARELLTIGGQAADGQGFVAVGGSVQATDEIAVSASGGSSPIGLSINSLSSITSDATGAFGASTAVFAIPSGPSRVRIETDRQGQIYGLIRAASSGLDPASHPDTVDINVGGLLLVDGFIDGDDRVSLTGGSDARSGISVLLTSVLVQTDAQGNELTDGEGKPIRIAGGTIKTGFGGKVTVTGTQDLAIGGVVGQPYVNGNVFVVDTAAVDMLSTAGDVNVTGNINARDAVNLSGENVNLLPGAVVKARAAAGNVSLHATGSSSPALPAGAVYVGSSDDGSGSALVDAGGLVHVFGDSIRVDGSVGPSGTADRILFSAIHDIVVTGLVKADSRIEFNAGVDPAWTTQLTDGSITVGQLSGGNIRVLGAGRLDSANQAQLKAGGDVEVKGQASAGADSVPLLVPYITQDATTIDVVVGSRQVAVGTITVPHISWLTTTVTNQVGYDTVVVGSTYNTLDATLIQDGWYNPSTGVFREYFLPDEDKSGYLPLYDFSWTNPNTHATVNGQPSDSPWSPDWAPKDDSDWSPWSPWTLVAHSVDTDMVTSQLVLSGYTVHDDPGSGLPGNVTRTFVGPAAASEKEYRLLNGELHQRMRSIAPMRIVYQQVTLDGAVDPVVVRMPNGAQNDIRQWISQGASASWQEVVGEYNDQATVYYQQTGSGFTPSIVNGAWTTAYYPPHANPDGTIHYEDQWTVSYRGNGVRAYSIADGRVGVTQSRVPDWSGQIRQNGHDINGRYVYAGAQFLNGYTATVSNESLMAANNLALNTSRSGFPSPVLSDRGWGGGQDKWSIVDGKQSYNHWANGLAFTGGVRSWDGEKGGIRQATIDFGTSIQFSDLVLWWHGDNNAPQNISLSYWNVASSQWVAINDSSRTYGANYQPGEVSGSATSDQYLFSPVTGSKVRISFDNLGKAINGNPMDHGWLYGPRLVIRVRGL